MKHSALILLTLFIFTGCTSTPKENGESALIELLEKRNLVVGKQVNNIFGRLINSWEYVDELNIILEAGVRDYYLIEFSYPCIGINSSFSIGYTSTGGSVSRFDKIVFKDFGRKQECRIHEITKLVEREADADADSK